MITFHAIDDAVVILRNKGVYKQVKAYKRAGRIYAAYGSGFISLRKDGTSAPNVNVDGLELGFEPEYTALGHMVEPGHPEAKKGR
jgi:hypothetical protein